MKKVITLLLACVLFFSLCACGSSNAESASEITPTYQEIEKVSLSDLDLLTPDERTLFLSQVNVALVAKSAEAGGKVYAYLPGDRRVDLSSFSEYNLQLLQRYLSADEPNGEMPTASTYKSVSDATDRIAEITGKARAVAGSGPAPDVEPSVAPIVDVLDGLDLEPHPGSFANESDLQSSLFVSVREIADQLDWLVTPLVTREGNPELSFDSPRQDLKYARFYLVFYGNVGKEEAKTTVAEYTEKMAAVLSELYPNIDADMVCFFWKIPVINEDSLYSASFFYHTENGILVNND